MTLPFVANISDLQFIWCIVLSDGENFIAFLMTIARMAYFFHRDKKDANAEKPPFLTLEQLPFIET